VNPRRFLSQDRSLDRDRSSGEVLDRYRSHIDTEQSSAKGAPSLRWLPVGAGSQSERGLTPSGRGAHLSLYKILFHFKALLWESIILVLSPPTCKQSLPYCMHYYCYCMTIAQYTSPPTDPSFLCHTPYNIGDANAISCKGQGAPASADNGRNGCIGACCDPTC